MSSQDNARATPANATLAAGVVIALAMIGAFLWGESHDVDTTPLLAILSPVVGALFLVPKVASIERTTEQVQRQTNGHLTNLTAENDRLRAENAALNAARGAITSSSRQEAVSDQLNLN